MSAALQVTSQHAQKFLGLVKGGAGKLITNIVESSNKMKEKVARSVFQFQFSPTCSTLCLVVKPIEKRSVWN